ncbi:MAG: HlyD family efflux transporter periplasmic adaptor subunit [Sedimentisphaerales bacterium]|nr:HlyD family efflux transporter periplasmic adaptor subunit [Sedimentisphaerales bacterium]
MSEKKDGKDAKAGPLTISELLLQIERSGDDTAQVLANILSGQCLLGKADAGAILCRGRDGRIDVAALYPAQPQQNGPADWLAESAALVQGLTSTDQAVLRPLSHSVDGHAVIVPLKITGLGEAAAVFHIRTDDKETLEKSSQTLQLTAGMLNCSRMGFERKSEQALRRLQQSMELLAALNREDKFISAAMALCNEAASQWQCERVSLGLLEGRYVRIKAMSHTEDFSRKMKILQAIEAAMEECLDQDVEILSPAAQDAAYVSRAALELARAYGQQTVLSLPLRRKGRLIAVLTLERPAEKPFTAEEIGAIRLTCELCAARLHDMYEHNRWIGATIALKTRNCLAGILGPKHTLAKLIALLVFAGILFLTFAKGQFRAEAPFVLEAVYQQVVPAPFDGYLKTVEVEVGQDVEGGVSVLASLDTAELRLQLAASKAEKAGYLKQASAAMRDGQTAQAQIAQANADKSQAQIELLDYMIGQANLVCPITGLVVKGDLKRQIGAPVKTGDVLFEVCPIESLRAQLMVAEDLIFDIKVAQKGRLATASYPARPVSFVVERINPMAEVVNQRNVFKVRVRLLETHSWMRPGMEGVAKVDVGKRRYIWIWTRKITNWLRMKFWL